MGEAWRGGGGHPGGMASGHLGMFPLSAVLFPHAAMALHVFEPRYQALVTDCLAGEGRFGVVLIARGSEVGGGDERFVAGTVASIEAAEPLGDGRWRLVARGVGLLGVRRWLDDDPYPRAVVDERAEGPVEDTGALVMAAVELGRVGALLGELGQAPTWPEAPSPGDAPEVVAWHLCARAPIGAFDRQRLLEAPGPDERVALLRGLLQAVDDDLRRILAGG